MHARAGNRFIQIHQFFALAEGIQKHRHGADIERMRADAHQMIENAGHFGKHHADILRALGHFDIGQLFHRQAVSLLVAHHGYIIQAVHIRQRLQIGAGFGQLFGAAVQEADVRVGAHDGFAVELQYHAQHAVRRRMLRAEVNGVVS